MAPDLAGWEAVLRIRCSKGIRINSFHGHFFIRSTDLLALPQARAAH
jgi:protein transport protein SEC24